MDHTTTSSDKGNTVSQVVNNTESTEAESTTTTVAMGTKEITVTKQIMPTRSWQLRGTVVERGEKKPTSYCAIDVSESFGNGHSCKSACAFSIAYFYPCDERELHPFERWRITWIGHLNKSIARLKT